MEATDSNHANHPIHCIVCGSSSNVSVEDSDEYGADRATALVRNDQLVTDDLVSVDGGWVHRNIALVGGARLPLTTF